MFIILKRCNSNKPGLKHKISQVARGCPEFISSGFWVVKLFFLKKLLKVLTHFEFCHKYSFVTNWVLSQFEFCHNLGFVTILVLSQMIFFHNFSLIKNLVLSLEKSSCNGTTHYIPWTTYRLKQPMGQLSENSSRNW